VVQSSTVGQELQWQRFLYREPWDASKAVTANIHHDPAAGRYDYITAANNENNIPLLSTLKRRHRMVKVAVLSFSKITVTTLDLLADGTHTIRVEATNNGVTGLCRVLRSLSDTIAPAVTVTALPAIVKAADADPGRYH